MDAIFFLLDIYVREELMSNFIRQTHRWLSMAFTACVIFTSVALAQENPAVWVSYVPLFPLALLFITGNA